MDILVCCKLTRAERTCNFVDPHVTSKTSLRTTLFPLNWLPPTFGHLPEDGNVQGSKRGKRGSVANILNSVNITITGKLQGELEKRGVSQYFWRDTNIVISSRDDTRDDFSWLKFIMWNCAQMQMYCSNILLGTRSEKKRDYAGKIPKLGWGSDPNPLLDVYFPSYFWPAKMILRC